MPNVVSKILATFLETGKRAMGNFIQAWLADSCKTKFLKDSVSTTKVTIFVDIRKNITSQKVSGLKADSEVLFRRLLVISKQRDVSVERILEH